MGYTKLFDSMWSGSLYGKFEASAVFMVMLSLSDAEGQVDMTHEAISGRTGWPLDFIREGIRQLELPDTRSRTPDADGRRIIKLKEDRDWGWFITNHAQYRDEMRSIERREYLRDAKRKEREKRRQQMSTSQPESTAVNPSYAYAYAEANTDKNPTARKAAPTDPEWFSEFKSVYPPRAGDQGWRKAIRAANARILEGHSPPEFVAGARRYAAFIAITDKAGSEYVKQAATFLGPDKPFLLPWNAPTQPETAMEEIYRATGGQSNGTGRIYENTEPSRPALAAPVRAIRGGGS